MRTPITLTISALILAAPAAGAAPGGDAFAAAWQRYIDEAVAVPLQPDCVPRTFPASREVARRGAVVMFHGFGGCPQQLFEFASRVAARGFDVLLPLLPGHGLVPGVDGKDDLSRLPDDKTWPRYPELAARMNDIMAKSEGLRIVVGFSLGGAVAEHAAMRAADEYDRGLFLAPMLGIRGGAIVEGLAELIGRTPGLQDFIVKPQSFLEECYRWQAAGRAGLCDYQFVHSTALVEFARKNRELAADAKLSMPIQVVAAGDEKYVDTAQIVENTEVQREFGPIELCFLPPDVPHEMLTPYENVGREMYWLDGLLRRLVAFVADGEFVPIRQGDADSDAPAGCRLD